MMARAMQNDQRMAIASSSVGSQCTAKVSPKRMLKYCMSSDFLQTCMAPPSLWSTALPSRPDTSKGPPTLCSMAGPGRQLSSPIANFKPPACHSTLEASSKVAMSEQVRPSVLPFVGIKLKCQQPMEKEIHGHLRLATQLLCLPVPACIEMQQQYMSK